MLTPGQRTITLIISVLDPEHRRAHDAYHRFLRDGVWEMHELWRALAVTMIERLVAPDAPVVIDLDDTTPSTTRPAATSRVPGSSVMRSRSTRNRTVHALGLNLVVITFRITPPWGGLPIGLPVAARVRRRTDGPTTVALARQVLGNDTPDVAPVGSTLMV